MKKKEKFRDDSRVVADMNFDGAPWQTKSRDPIEIGSDQELLLTKKETFQVMKTALFAGLIIGIIFVGAFLIFILFSTKIWLR
ncbi:MAG: Uncharacterized protein XD91_0520 [Clostridiales bacterium 38_11]|nr:MAG: Uncharacterized protein XD91_0520 [Clostridiales bacterium 38_11]HBH13290.1 hypothetical protein [Clostridiales bacterium]